MSPRLPCVADDCERPVLPEEDHVRVEGHLIHTDDRDGQDTYYAHPDCWRQISEEWSHP